MIHIFPILHAAVKAFLPQITDADEREAVEKYLNDLEMLLVNISQPFMTSQDEYSEYPNEQTYEKAVIDQKLSKIKSKMVCCSTPIDKPLPSMSNIIDFKPRPRTRKRTKTDDLIAILECRSDGFGGFEYAAQPD